MKKYFGTKVIAILVAASLMLGLTSNFQNGKRVHAQEQINLDLASEAQQQVEFEEEGGVTILSGFQIQGFQESSEELVYNGEEITQNISIYYNDILLEEDVDYVVSYKNNIEAATHDAHLAPTMTIRMRGQFSGSRNYYFSISPRDLKSAGINGYEQAVTYQEKLNIPEPIFYYKDKPLVYGRDFICDYSGLPDDYLNGDSYEEGIVYTYEVKGTGNFSGSVPMSLMVVREENKNLSIADIKLKTEVYLYNGDSMTAEEVQTEWIKIAGEEIDARYYKWNVDAEEVGIGYLTLYPTEEGKNMGYYGSKTIQIQLIPDRQLSDAVLGERWQEQITFSQSLLVENGGIFQNGESILAYETPIQTDILVEGRDYTIKYKNASEVGIATVIFYGKGRYAGTLQKNYTIIPDNELTIQWMKVDEEGKPYAIYQKEGTIPEFQLLDREGNVLNRRTDYYVRTRDNQKPGVMFLELIGRGNYAGYRMETDIVVKPADISNAKMEIEDVPYTQDVNGWKAPVVIRDVNGKKMLTGKDYDENLSYTYENMKEQSVPQAGTTVFVTAYGINNYAGSTITGSYRICKWHMKKLDIIIDDQIYTGREIIPEPEQIHIYANKNDMKSGKEISDCSYEIVACENNVRVGTARITVKGIGEYGGSKTVYFYIKKKNYEIIPVTYFELNTTKVEGYEGTTYQLQCVKIQPLNANELQANYRSSDETVATVDGNGVILLKKPGVAMVTVTFPGSECIRKCMVTVKKEEENLPQGNYLTPLQFREDGDMDDTDSFNRAISKLNEYGYDTLYVPAGIYDIDAIKGIHLKSNMNFIMSEDAVLQAVGNSSQIYDILKVSNIADVTITGGQIKGERYQHGSSAGEWGMGIGIYDGIRIHISNVKIMDCWGDGIYVGTSQDDNPNYSSKEISIVDCVLDNNRRNNLSIVAGDYVVVDGCSFINANGTAPQYGIDIETNNSENSCEHITISDCNFEKNKSAAFGIITSANDVTLENCNISGDLINYAGNNLKISDSMIYGNVYARIGISMKNGVKINSGSMTEDELVATFDARKNNLWVGNYNHDSNNTMLKGYMDNELSPSGRVLRMERTSQGTKESGYYLNLSDLLKEAGNKLEAGSTYRFEYTVRGFGQWGIKTDQTTWYPCAPQMDVFATGATVYKASSTGQNSRLIFFAQEMTKGMCLEVDSVRIYKVK